MKKFIAGILTGIILTASIPVVAANITAVADSSINLMINGVMKTLPEDVSILLYNNRTYLPLRYIAEELGADVNWHDADRLVTVVMPEPEVVEKIVEVPVEVKVEVERIVYRDRETGEQSTVALSELPVSSTRDRIRLRAENIYVFNGGAAGGGRTTRLEVSLNNDGNRGDVRFLYSQAVLIADGIEYKTDDASFFAWDERFFSSYIPQGEEYAGYLVFPRVPASAKEFTLKVPVERQWDSSKVDFELIFRASVDDD
jgi:hypothetical protein